MRLYASYYYKLILLTRAYLAAEYDAARGVPILPDNELMTTICDGHKHKINAYLTAAWFRYCIGMTLFASMTALAKYKKAYEVYFWSLAYMPALPLHHGRQDQLSEAGEGYEVELQKLPRH